MSLTSGETALVTGVSGYIAGHVTDMLLQAGYTVRGTVRSVDKFTPLAERFQNTYGNDKFDVVEVKDLEDAGAFDEAVKGIKYIFHIASPLPSGGGDPYKGFINPAVNGTLSVLKAAHAHGAAKRIVITSSDAAVRGTPRTDGHVYTEKDWNEDSMRIVKEGDKEAASRAAYAASKTEAEKAAWRFVEENKPTFDIATINPSFVFGPQFYPVGTESDIRCTPKILYSYIKGDVTEVLPRKPLQNYVNVRDVARAHLVAATEPRAAGKRFLLVAGGWSSARVAEIIRRNFPHLRKVPTGSLDETFVEDVDSSASKDVLGIRCLGLEETVVDTIKSFKHLVKE
ncbi:hypothetical protein DFJ77DRAFT_457215 [Powellomyces hirtus]|nr:hypothetical protein DFJ77DRAFT_457215 [Powellomyces hirtus]